MAKVEWSRLCDATIKDYVKSAEETLATRLKLLHLLSPPSERRNYPPLPPPTLEEIQSRCSHTFVRRGPKCVCKNCKLSVHPEFAKGFDAGFDRGHESGMAAAFEEM